MKEDYCSYEVAKLLKEKGFDVELQCYSYDAVTKENVDIYWQKNINGLLPRCTHQLAMKWLREVYKLFIDISFQKDEDDSVTWFYMTWALDNRRRDVEEVDFASYEEAVEAAIKYTLENLI